MRVEELVECLRTNEFHQVCWEHLKKSASESKEFNDLEKLQKYLEDQLQLPVDLVREIMQVVDIRRGLWNSIIVLLNPRVIITGEGWQYFGSADYKHKTYYFGGSFALQKLAEIEYNNGFVYGHYAIERVIDVTRPATIYHTAYDYIGDGKRFFNNELYIWV